MEFKIEDKFYTILFVNILPGLIAFLEILLFFGIRHPNEAKSIINSIPMLMEKPYFLIALILLVFFIGTTLGIIIDTIRHLIFNDYISKSRIPLIVNIKNKDQLEIYKHYRTTHWYSYEATGNIGITMVPGIFLLLVFFRMFESDLIFAGGILVLYVSITVIMINFARIYLKELSNVDKEFLKVINGDQESPYRGNLTFDGR